MGEYGVGAIRCAGGGSLPAAGRRALCRRRGTDRASCAAMCCARRTPIPASASIDVAAAREDVCRVWCWRSPASDPAVMALGTQKPNQPRKRHGGAPAFYLLGVRARPRARSVSSASRSPSRWMAKTLHQAKEGAEAMGAVEHEMLAAVPTLQEAGATGDPGRMRSTTSARTISPSPSSTRPATRRRRRRDHPGGARDQAHDAHQPAHRTSSMEPRHLRRMDARDGRLTLRVHGAGSTSVFAASLAADVFLACRSPDPGDHRQRRRRLRHEGRISRIHIAAWPRREMLAGAPVKWVGERGEKCCRTSTAATTSPRGRARARRRWQRIRRLPRHARYGEHRRLLSRRPQRWSRNGEYRRARRHLRDPGAHVEVNGVLDQHDADRVLPRRHALRKQPTYRDDGRPRGARARRSIRLRRLPQHDPGAPRCPTRRRWSTRTTAATSRRTSRMRSLWPTTAFAPAPRPNPNSAASCAANGISTHGGRRRMPGLIEHAETRFDSIRHADGAGRHARSRPGPSERRFARSLPKSFIGDRCGPYRVQVPEIPARS